jgi:hypothetical protein
VQDASPIVVALMLDVTLTIIAVDVKRLPLNNLVSR